MLIDLNRNFLFVNLVEIDEIDEAVVVVVVDFPVVEGNYWHYLGKVGFGRFDSYFGEGFEMVTVLVVVELKFPIDLAGMEVDLMAEFEQST